MPENCRLFPRRRYFVLRLLISLTSVYLFPSCLVVTNALFKGDIASSFLRPCYGRQIFIAFEHLELNTWLVYGPSISAFFQNAVTPISEFSSGAHSIYDL